MMPQFEKNIFHAHEEVLVHEVRGYPEHEYGEFPGKIVKVAIKFVTIEWQSTGGTQTAKFHKESRHTGDHRGENYGPWFERPWEKQTRLAVERATEILKRHGFLLARVDPPSHAKIIGVAAFLEGHKR